jgi:hypothetical protein
VIDVEEAQAARDAAAAARVTAASAASAPEATAEAVEDARPARPEAAERRSGSTPGQVVAPFAASSAFSAGVASQNTGVDGQNAAHHDVPDPAATAAPTTPAPSPAPAEEVQAVAPPAASWVTAASAGPAPPPAPVNGYDLLDSRSPMPEATEDATPIFATLRSNWLSADGTEGTWTTSEIEAGWEAAEQVAEAPARQLSESGLPVRRPGRQLVPGGVTAAPVAARDPEAIRARLAAHAAGVTRGRTAAVDDSVPASSTVTSTEEGPA